MGAPYSAKALYLSHGGGPLPLLGDTDHAQLVEALTALAGEIEKPKTIIVLSAHWEAPMVTITSSPTPRLIYDYHGFPEESYAIQYPALGNPVLAESLYVAFQSAGLKVRLDEQRGFDHGVFVPLKIMYPKADIPCVQISLLHNLSPQAHIEMGQALKSLNVDGVLVLGSGFSFHNMREFFAISTPEAVAKNTEFDTWLTATCMSKKLTQEQRLARLAGWEQAPHARFNHPREEHLLPLHVCCGFTGKAADVHYPLTIIAKKASMYIWYN